MLLVDNHLGAGFEGLDSGYPSGSAVQAIYGALQAPNRGMDYEFSLLRRPYYPDRGPNAGRPCLTVNTGQWTVERGVKRPIYRQHRIWDLMNSGYNVPMFVLNATTLRKEEWIYLDKVVLREYRARLRAWSDLVAANSFGGFDAMAKLTLEYEAMSDPGIAVVDMEATTAGPNDTPIFDLRSMPLPITHCDFGFSRRRLAVSGNTNTPIDTTMAEAAARRVGESVEKQTIGTVGGVSYGYVSTGPTAHNSTLKSKVYGYLTYPYRITKTNITAPTSGSWSPETLQQEFNACLQLLRAQNQYGPFIVYNSTDWDTYLDGDYYVSKTSGAVAPTITLRERLKKLSGIQDIRRLDFMTASAISASQIEGTNPFTLIFVQMQAETAQAVNGMGVTTVQWETIGGMRLNFKVMCIQVPLIRSDYRNRCGILVATTS